jgi:hypothetical protein
LKRHDNGLDETGHRSSDLLRVLKELLKSDEMQIAVDMSGAPKICGEVATKVHRRKPFVTMKGHIGLGTEHVEPGDAIAFLSGLSGPVCAEKEYEQEVYNCR